MFDSTIDLAWIGPRAPPPAIENQLRASFAARVASLCPTSSVEIRACFDGISLGPIVRPGDWREFSDAQLTARVGCEAGALFAIRDQTGEVFGRVGVLKSTYNVSAGAITYHGIRSGSLSGLIGLTESGDNNADAKRVDATVPGSEASWRHGLNELSMQVK